MNILGVIPAREGSSLKDKNIMPVLGKPLIGYTIEAALQSELIDKLVVSTDSDRIGDVSKSYNVQVIERPQELAQDDSPIEEALRHVMDVLERENYYADIVVLMQANVPHRKAGMIDKVIQKLIETKADSVVSVHEVDQLPEIMKTMDASGKLTSLAKKPVSGIRRQEFEKKFLLDGAVLAIKAEILRATAGKRQAHVYLGENIYGVVQESEYSVEIDCEEDFKLAEFYLAKK